MGADVADDPEMKPHSVFCRRCPCCSAACCASMWGQHGEVCPRIIYSPCWGLPQSPPLRMKSFLN